MKQVILMGLALCLVTNPVLAGTTLGVSQVPGTIPTTIPATIPADSSGVTPPWCGYNSAVKMLTSSSHANSDFTTRATALGVAKTQCEAKICDSYNNCVPVCNIINSTSGSCDSTFNTWIAACNAAAQPGHGNAHKNTGNDSNAGTCLTAYGYIGATAYPPSLYNPSQQAQFLKMACDNVGRDDPEASSDAVCACRNAYNFEQTPPDLKTYDTNQYGFAGRMLSASVPSLTRTWLTAKLPSMIANYNSSTAAQVDQAQACCQLLNNGTACVKVAP